MSRVELLAPDWRARIERFSPALLDDLLETAPDPARLPGTWRALDKPGLGGRERWRWTPPDRPDGPAVFVKRYRRSRIREQWDRLLRQSARRSRAFWEYARAIELAEACILAPRAVGFAEVMLAGFERQSVVLLEQVAGQPFDKAWREWTAAGDPIARGLARHDLARRLAWFVSAFHGTGLTHRDLYLCHIFIERGAAGDPPRLAIIDLARTHRPRFRRMRWLLKDLSQLDASAREIGLSRTDRLRFLRVYLGLEAGSPRVRWYCSRILRRSDWILRRIARKQARRAVETHA